MVDTELKRHVERKPFWIEFSNGVPLFCFKIRRHGKYETHRYSLDELKQILAPH